MKWFKIISWHIGREFLILDDVWYGVSLCGLYRPLGETESSMPTKGRTCESCLRIEEKVHESEHADA